MGSKAVKSSQIPSTRNSQALGVGEFSGEKVEDVEAYLEFISNSSGSHLRPHLRQHLRQRILVQAVHPYSRVMVQDYTGPWLVSVSVCLWV